MGLFGGGNKTTSEVVTNVTETSTALDNRAQVEGETTNVATGGARIVNEFPEASYAKTLDTVARIVEAAEERSAGATSTAQALARDVAAAAQTQTEEAVRIAEARPQGWNYLVGGLVLIGAIVIGVTLWRR